MPAPAPPSPVSRRGRPWLRPTLLAAAVMAVVLVADRITKHVVRADIGFQDSRHVIGNTLQLVHYRNTGVAFDVLSGGGVAVLAVTVIALLALLTFFVMRPDRRGLWVPTGLLLGGAIGNLLDRVLDGSVTDFIKLPHWPAFNVADIAITIGVLSLLWVLEAPAARGRGSRRT